jgi:hypothetical protein
MMADDPMTDSRIVLRADCHVEKYSPVWPPVFLQDYFFLPIIKLPSNQ